MKNVKTRRIHALMDHANAEAHLGLCATLTLISRFAHWAPVFVQRSEDRLKLAMDLVEEVAFLLRTSAIPTENVRVASAMEIAMD